MPRLLTARLLLPDPERLLSGGGVLCDRGRILRVLDGPAAVRRAARASGVRVQDAGDCLLAPGLVNAHAHLELGWAHRELTVRGGFSGWVRALVERRREVTAEEGRRSIETGVEALLSSGTTTVGDIDSSDCHDGRGRASAGDRGRIRIVRFREVLDAWDPARTGPALRRVARPLARRSGVLEGLSPHAPFTASRELLRRCAELARARGIPVQVHWAESEEEREWLLSGRGPFAPALGPSPRTGGLALLEEAGLLGPSTSLVHGNLPERGDVARVAASGATLVHCPGTHRFFDRPRFPWRRWRRAGVPVALGTDSLASNALLSLRHELALAREAEPALAPATLWNAATRAGARALGLAGRVGELSPGAAADVVAWHGIGAGRAPTLRGVLDALTGEDGRLSDPRRVHVGGSRV